jgi:hypothetical protein
MKRIRIRYLLNGFETEYLEDIAQKLVKKGLVEIVAPEQAKTKKKTGSEEKPKAER